ncbi:hypothetical protein NTHI1209_01298 [Haemophilus influenzae]|uniref:Uncharacterized protein n=1 Tax=Haemophilus influenzae TaxID=727 RepID=A0A158SXU6_HAEIF|nr:hypothetical protein NTHI1209_01298 [Haemophilus influenzae]
MSQCVYLGIKSTNSLWSINGIRGINALSRLEFSSGCFFVSSV